MLSCCSSAGDRELVNENHKLPEGLGVISYKGEIIVYEMVEILDEATRTGVLIPTARILGRDAHVEMTPDLRAAIEQDLQS